jgi:hypothetical protein
MALVGDEADFGGDFHGVHATRAEIRGYTGDTFLKESHITDGNSFLNLH